MRLDHLLSRENDRRKAAGGRGPPVPFASAPRGSRPWGLAPGHLESRIAKKSGLKFYFRRRKQISLTFILGKCQAHQCPAPPPERGEGAKGARRMPWHGEPTKGAGSRDSPWGAALGLRSRGARMGEPSRRGPAIPYGRATGGTETSKYPEEGKSTETPRVAASERGPAQTGPRVRACARCRPGVAGATSGGRTPRLELQSTSRAEHAWEGGRNRVRAPYAKAGASRSRPRVPPGT